MGGIDAKAKVTCRKCGRTVDGMTAATEKWALVREIPDSPDYLGICPQCAVDMVPIPKGKLGKQRPRGSVGSIGIRPMGGKATIRRK